MSMKVLQFVLMTGLAFGQTVTVTVVMPDGTTTYAEAISGPVAKAGIETAIAFMSSQKVACEPTQPPLPACVPQPKYDNPADFIKQAIVNLIEQIAEQYPSSATKAAQDTAQAQIDAVRAARRALLDAARAQKSGVKMPPPK